MRLRPAQRTCGSCNYTRRKSVLPAMGRPSSFGFIASRTVGRSRCSLLLIGPCKVPKYLNEYFYRVSCTDDEFYPCLSYSLLRATDTSPLPGITATGISQAAGNVHRISPGAVGGIVAGITTLLLIIAAALFIVKRKRLQGNPSVVLETTARPYTPPIVERRMALSCGHSSDRLIIPPSKHSRSDPSGMEGTDSIPGPSTSDIFATDPMASPYFSQPQADRGEEGYPAGERPYVMNLVASPALIDHLNRFIPPESPIGYAQDEPPRYVR